MFFITTYVAKGSYNVIQQYVKGMGPRHDVCRNLGSVPALPIVYLTLHSLSPTKRQCR